MKITIFILVFNFILIASALSKTKPLSKEEQVRMDSQ
jgi:hypothetical protein